MTFTKIQNFWDQQHYELQTAVDAMCVERVKHLVYGLKHFRITKLMFGNGGWAVFGSDFPVDYDDESHGVQDIRRLIDWCTNGGSDHYVFAPTEITQLEVEIVRELHALCEWWCDISGGEDVTFYA